MEVNILIIEDDVKVAGVLETTLKSPGYKVWLVDNPHQGLALARNTNFACVITELRSPYMNGVKVTKAIREISPNINVVVLTVYSFISSAVEAMEAGAYGYITKPLNTSEIRIVVERAIERSFLSSSEVKKDYYAQLSMLDALTGLYNYRYFKEFLNSEFLGLMRQQQKASILMLDIDDFKKYNDTYGHPAGDELLCKLANILKDALRDIDTLCRYGGEEFVIVLPRADKKGAEIVAKRMITLVNLYLPLTISIGIATYPDDAKEQQALVKKSDEALYNAKQSGKNKFCVA
jgi:diguanylate cyclase (GGDEF)-like protein